MSARKLLMELIILALSWAVPCLAQAPQAERPRINIGDASTFIERNVITGEARETRFHVIAVDASVIVVAVEGSISGQRTFTRDWNLLEIKTGDMVTQTVRPYWPHLRFPLRAGETWDTPFDIQITTRAFNRYARWEWRASVVGIEPVTVPAGTFQAFRIEYDGAFTSQQNGRTWTGTQKETAWYAPDVRRIVRRDYQQSAPANNFFEHHVIELTAFRPGP